jgi:hypothetical protein
MFEDLCYGSKRASKTRERLGLRPTGPALMADLEQMHYFAN